MPISFFGWSPRSATPVDTAAAVAASETAGSRPPAADDRTKLLPSSRVRPSGLLSRHRTAASIQRPPVDPEIERAAALAAGAHARRLARIDASSAAALAAQRQATDELTCLQTATDAQASDMMAEALQPPPLPPGGADPAPKPRFMDRLRRPLDALRLRTAVPRVELVIGPLNLSRSNSTSEPSLEERPRIFQATTTASERGLKAVDRLVDAAAHGVGQELTKGSPLATGQDGVDNGRRAAAPAAAGSAVDFNAEIERMFPAASPSTRLATIRLAATLLDHPNPDPGRRPDGHPLRYEQSLLIATVLRSVTADPVQASQVYQRLRLETPPALDDLCTRGSDGPTPPLADLGTALPAVARMTHAARRALAVTAGGFQALLDLQGLALPQPGDPRRGHAEEAIEYYQLGLHAEEALLAAGLDVGGTQSMADIRAALDTHPQRRELLDPGRLGTGNARRRPRGPHEPEHPATLAAQAFLYATDNLRRAPGQGEQHRDLKPAYVALRNGFTTSGQGSDFHLMAKRLRKFITYIDLACKTPHGDLPTAMHKARLPIRLLQRHLAGKGKSPLETLLKAGPIETAATIKTPQGEMDTRQDAKRLQHTFEAASPAERRDILRQVMNAVTRGRLGTYSDSRRHGIGVTAGYGLAKIGGLGGVGVGITPVVEVGAEHSRTAVFKAGIAGTGTLYLGSERKLSGAVGAGVRAGAEAGPIAGVSAQAMARIGGSHLVSRGLMIRTRKAERDHEALSAGQTAGLQSTDWQRMNELVINSIFQIADRDKADRPAHGGAMWAQLVDKLGDYRDISFGWNEGKAVTADVSVTLDATASATLAPGVAVSASAGISLKRTLFDRKRTRDAAGTARSMQAEQGSRSALRVGAGLGISSPAFTTPSGRSIAVFGRHRVGVETEVVIQSQNGLVRLVTEGGRLRPELSSRDREFGVREDFIQAMNAQRARWVAALDARGPDGRPRGGDEQYDEFMDRLVNLRAAGSRVYREHQTLTTEAAEVINACMDRLAVLQRPLPPGVPQDPGALDQVEDLQRRIAAHVANPAHWLPAGMDVVQPMQAAAAWSGGVDASVTMQPGSGHGDGADRLLGGGRLALGGSIRTAVGGKILLALDVPPRPGATPGNPASSRPHEARLSAIPAFSDSTMHDTMAMAH